MSAWSMIDPISTRTPTATLQPAKLSEQHRVVGEFHVSSVHNCEQLQVQPRAVNLSDVVLDPPGAKLLAWKLASESVAYHARDSISLEEVTALLGDASRVERRQPCAHGVNDAAVSIAVSNRTGEGITTAPAGIDESRVDDAVCRRPLPAIRDTGIDRIRVQQG